MRAWLRARQERSGYAVERVPLEALDLWRSHPESGDLEHRSGRFFRVEGLRVKTNFPFARAEWDQPIINQPEVGILGILSKVVDGRRYFLLQAKMEPGNINRVQLSPTVQATKSNFTRVHGGRPTRYLEHFVRRDARILVDQLQSEQGTRFLRKRNRNMLVEVTEPVEPHADFRWLTLGELKQLLREDDLVNMDTRTVLSCLPLASPALRQRCAALSPGGLATPELGGRLLTGFARDLFVSLVAGRRALHESDALISWFTHLKTIYELDTRYLPLREVREWERADGVIRHARTNFFSVIGLDVRAAEREVASWMQPILAHDGLGLVGYLVQRLQGVLHFLVQAKVEPGICDILEMGPTVSVWDVERRGAAGDTPFLEQFLDPPAERVRLSVVLSEEGGRLFHLRNRYVVVELPEGEALELPENFTWMTLGQIMEFVRFNNHFNIEARGLLSCLPFLPEGAA